MINRIAKIAVATTGLFASLGIYALSTAAFLAAVRQHLLSPDEPEIP